MLLGCDRRYPSWMPPCSYATAVVLGPVRRWSKIPRPAYRCVNINGEAEVRHVAMQVSLRVYRILLRFTGICAMYPRARQPDGELPAAKAGPIASSSRNRRALPRRSGQKTKSLSRPRPAATQLPVYSCANAMIYVIVVPRVAAPCAHRRSESAGNQHLTAAAMSCEPIASKSKASPRLHLHAELPVQTLRHRPEERIVLWRPRTHGSHHAVRLSRVSGRSDILSQSALLRLRQYWCPDIPGKLMSDASGSLVGATLRRRTRKVLDGALSERVEPQFIIRKENRGSDNRRMTQGVCALRGV